MQSCHLHLITAIIISIQYVYKKFLLSAAIHVTAISPYIYYFYEHFISVRKINVAWSTLPLYMLGVYYRVKLPIRVIFLLTVVLEISGITLICFSCFDNSGQLWVWRLLMLLIAYIFLYNMVCAKATQELLLGLFLFCMRTKYWLD